MSKDDRTHLVNSVTSCEQMVEKVRQLFREHRYVELSWQEGTQRTGNQNRALHLWFGMLANTLNENGLDKEVVLERLYTRISAPWTKTAVKEDIWRPVQEAVIHKGSTVDADRTEYTPIYEALAKWFAQEFGIAVPPWPKREKEE